LLKLAPYNHLTMPFFPELFAVAVVAMALLMYIITRIINNNSSYKSGKLALLEHHRRLRARSNKLQDVLSSHIMENHVDNDPFIDDYNYADFLKHLQKNHIKHLSDKNYARIKNTNNRIVLNAAKATLKEQELKLDNVAHKMKQFGLQDAVATLLPSGQD
jgi:hypothetical protein